ncbi:acyltransferase family protein [Jannaschia rubra]|uniref:O-acetyltransferase OatA n=1 Tax=Jannaschia rubra TaxID=282197 RepID=A0A0M6XPV8_9RHOB|nr:acyltransferase family protein [Jannaschia rubra]CTQ32692.1 O-acetyltransferase OatA [Jannaschia rubra]SFF87600.1 Acyltransferase family protein [Jannaschia rubra]
MSLRYRPEIDGLRAVAVLPVVAFRFGAPWAPGGFVAVDVFFVISGFLITSIIRRELGEGTFSLAGFYERRIRRILPALFVVIVASLAAAMALFLPHHLRDAGQSAAAATFFASNVLFLLKVGYLDAAAYTKPLLHTWSLPIEEQFFIFVPLILMALAALNRQAILWVGGLTAASFALSAATTTLMPTAAYYRLPWRAWEMGVGALPALKSWPLPHRRALRESVMAGGLLLIGPRSGALSYDADRTAFFLDRLEKAIRRLRGAGKQVMLVYPPPEAEQTVPEAAARTPVRGSDPEDLSISREGFDRRAAGVIEGYDRLVEDYDLLGVRIDRLLCDNRNCDLFLDGTPLFRDTNHLTETAAYTLAPQFIWALRELETIQ